MPSRSTNTVTTPITSAGRASSRNIHCQPRMPCVPLNASMIQPDSGLPNMPAMGMPDMNSAIILPRRLAGNQ
ncbi:hypothetical protein D3C78_1941300 [compost metagenome]